jgi:hypothetical protein
LVIGRAVHEAPGFDKESLNRSVKMIVPTMGPNTDFEQWKRNFLTFLSLKAAYLIQQLAIRESGVWIDEAAQTYAYALLLHAASENKRADHAVKCIYAAHHDCAIAAWDIRCEGMDGRSFARSFSLLDNLMLRQRPCQSLTKYIHFLRQTFDDYNETCEMMDGSAAIHPPHVAWHFQHRPLWTGQALWHRRFRHQIPHVRRRGDGQHPPPCTKHGRGAH